MQKSCTVWSLLAVSMLLIAGTLLDFQGWTGQGTPGLDVGFPFASLAMAQEDAAAPAEGDPVEGDPEAAPLDQPSDMAEPTPAEEEETTTQANMRIAYILGFLILVIVVPYVAGNMIARGIRLPEYGWRLGIVLSSVVTGIVVVSLWWPPKFGIDLKGGVILVYEVDEEATQEMEEIDGESDSTTRSGGSDDISRLITQLQRRINPAGALDVMIRPYGNNQVEVIIPDAESSELDLIKNKITKAGILEFMMVANTNDHELLINRAQDPNQVGLPYVTSRSNNIRMGRWVRIERDEEGEYRFFPGAFQARQAGGTPMLTPYGHLVRGGLEGEPLEVLMKMEPEGHRVQGKHLSSARVGRDERGGRAVIFEMTGEGSIKMGNLTRQNISDNKIERKMGIVMDGFVVSAPAIRAHISSSGNITGQFTEEEVRLLADVMQAGNLPVSLRKEPISEQTISATLGDDTIRRGQVAIAVSLASVLLFMLVYYRVAGVLACISLLLNILFILGIMILISADLTLPGIAGLVLTVGMAVDANVLIFERIREELKIGSSLRMALVNGYGKAMSTIVDANLTTMITALILYRIGTDQVRGFAVTLFFGIVMSMFTAIFVSRTLFDIMERKRWIKSLSMAPSVSSLGFDFIGKRGIAAVCSIALLIVSLVAVGVRGREIFDIDFRGGSSIQIFLEEAMPIAEVRTRLSDELPDLALSAVTVPGLENRIYKVDTSLAGYGLLGTVVLTDRTGQTAEVDLSPAETLAEIIELLNGTELALTARPNVNEDAIVFQDTSDDGTGPMAVASGDDTNTARRLNIEFSSESERHETGRVPEGIEVVQREMERIFRDENGKSLLVMHSMNFAGLTPLAAPRDEEEPASEVETPGDAQLGAEPAATEDSQPESPEPDSSQPAESPEMEPMTPAEPMTEAPAPADEPSSSEPATTEPETPATPEPEKPQPETPEPETPEPAASESESAPMPEESSSEETDSPEPAPEEPMSEDSPEPAAPESEDQSRTNLQGLELLARSFWISQLMLVQEEGDQPPADSQPGESEGEPAPAEQPESQPEPMTEIAEPEAAESETPASETPASTEETSPDSPAEGESDPMPVDAAQPSGELDPLIPGLPMDEEPGAQFPGGQFPGLDQEEAAPSQSLRYRTESELSFDEPMTADALRSMIEQMADNLGYERPLVMLIDEEGRMVAPDSRVSLSNWKVRLSSDEEVSEAILSRLSSRMKSMPVWPSSSKIGSKVAGDMQTMALGALAFSLIGIIGYIWFRFQNVAFGLAAVVALVHDVIITLGAIALSYWLQHVFGFLMISDFKISLPVVAAFLTIIGYSLNDTIVVFDRIREVRGKNPQLTSEMVNFSINQTLGRTILTSLTTLIVVIILYTMGGEAIHAFAFALVVGVIVGTYSSVFVAAPTLLWMMNRKKRSTVQST
ncbi:MAG: protein translocase subunit SecD [Pirellulaceae bacterium]